MGVWYGSQFNPALETGGGSFYERWSKSLTSRYHLQNELSDISEFCVSWIRNLQLDTSWHVNQYRAPNSFDSVFLSSRGAHASVYPAIMKDIQVLTFKAGMIVHQVYFMNHRYDGVQLWDVRTIFGVRELVWAMSFISFFFLYPSTFNLLEVAAVDKPKLHMWETGIMRITRHPQV